MFRIFVVVSVFLILGVTAKPWNKLTNEAYKEKVVSVDERGKLSWEVEVEPPEDMDGIHYEIDPRMRIWEDMKAPKFEEDLDELLHPSTAELHDQIHQIQNLNLASEVQEEPPKSVNLKYKQEVEGDRDDIAHPDFTGVVAEEPEKSWNEEYKKVREELAPLLAGYKAEVGGAPYQDETDQDQSSLSRREVRIHLKPEEDMDHIYHKDILMPVLHQDDTKAAAAPEDLPPQRKYSEPEEDLDGLYHQ